MKGIQLALVLLAVVLVGCAGPEGQSPDTQVRVTTVPEGALVYCDDVAYDASPLTIEHIEPGMHLITAKKEGHHDARKSVVVLPGQKTAVDLKLEVLYGLVLIRSTPEGADVEIDGAFRGKTPLMVPDFPLGRHRLTFRREGSLDRDLELTVNDRIPRKVDVDLASDTARLQVASQPSGATVLINGVSRGVTPIELDDVPSGPSTLEVTLNGYKTFKESLMLNAGGYREVRAVLDPLLAVLQVVSMPSGARVYLDNQYQGDAPVTVENLKPGQYRVRVELEGYETDARSVQVEAQQRVTEEFRFFKNSGMLILTTSPPGVKVFVDGKLRGTTAGPGGSLISEPLEVDLLAEGRHVLQLTKKGYMRKPSAFQVASRKVVTLHEELMRLFIPDTMVRTGDGPDDVRTGVLLERAPNGDVKLEVSRGVIIDIRAKDIREVRPLAE